MLVKHYFWSVLYVVLNVIMGRKYYVWKTYSLTSLMIDGKDICVGITVSKKGSI